MNIRFALPEDAQAVARAHVASWQTTYRGIVADEILDNLSVESRVQYWQEFIPQAEAQRSCLFVAEENSHIVGFCSAGPGRNPIPGFPAELYAIYLLQSVQRRGIGRSLVCTAASRLARHGFRAMFVWVLRDNPARHFYQALGAKYLQEKPITIGTQELIESAYGWDDLDPLTRPAQ
ncbi:MAG TPA: GNAT family N-acetyltransferase [Anaerolineae bacterium]|jgi:ribosomal protein S18 acetylase RimI-like enzyme|nr:GNAT family N-acetyltransferase [Anaerolineae bacterium]